MTADILILGADLSDNSLGRAWILADMLARYTTVEIAGIARDETLWPPLAQNTTHTVTAIVAKRFPNLVGTLKLLRFVRAHDADIIYISKPKFPAMVAALLGKRGRRVVLDIDDWEAGCARGNFAKNPFINALTARGISFTQLADWMIPLIKARTVCNIHFQKRYGGTLVPHARDAKRFETERGSMRNARKEFNLPLNETIVMFFGTPHRHKGIDHLIRAITLCKHQQITMLVAGLDPKMQEYPDYVAHAERELAGRYHFLPFVDWDKAPRLLAAVDMLVIPQKLNRFTKWGQTPAKVFDAMAAGKPLVVSDIADTAQLVRGNAWLVPPDDPLAIAAALDAILSDEKTAQHRASKLQERFHSLYSYDHVAPRLYEAVTQIPAPDYPQQVLDDAPMDNVATHA